MTIHGKASVVGAYEHPTRHAPDKSLAQLHAEVAKGALEDAGLSHRNVDGFFCGTDSPGLGPMSMNDYLGLRVHHLDSTDIGGASYLSHVGHAAQALVTLAGRPRSIGWNGTRARTFGNLAPDSAFEFSYCMGTANVYGMSAMRHMHDYGTTSEQLTWIKVAASHHARHTLNAMLRDVVTV